MTPITDALAEQGPHESKIRALFPDAFAWQGPEPLFSKPLYVLAFTNRSGSNLLADYLLQTGRFRGFGEALTAADAIVITDVYGAGEMPQPGISGKLIVDAVCE